MIPSPSEARAAPTELAPASPAEAGELLAELARRKGTVAFAGGETEP